MVTLAVVAERSAGGIPLEHEPVISGSMSAADTAVTDPTAPFGSRIRPAPAGLPRARAWVARIADTSDWAARLTSPAAPGRTPTSTRPKREAKMTATMSNSISVKAARRFISWPPRRSW